MICVGLLVTIACFILNNHPDNPMWLRLTLFGIYLVAYNVAAYSEHTLRKRVEELEDKETK